jgi:hypothetical protein
MSMAIHPNFTIFGAFLTLMIVAHQIRKGIKLHLIFFIIIEAIPLLIMLAWYLKNPESADAFITHLFHVTHVNKGKLIRFDQFETLIRSAFMFGGWDSIKVQVAYLVFYLPFLLIIIASLVVLLKKSKGMIKQDTFNIIIISLFVGTILIMLASFHIFSYFVVYSFFIILFYTIFIAYNSTFNFNTGSKKNFLSTIVLSSLIIIVLTSTLIHTVKFVFSSQQYYFAPKTYKAVINELKQGDTLFIFDGSQIPTFFNLVDDKFRGNNMRNVYMICPSVANNDHLRKARLSLLEKIKTIVHEKTVWGVRKKRATLDRTNMEIALREYNMFLNFKVKEIVYEDKDHIYIRPDSISETGDIEINQSLQILQTNS